MVVRTSWCAPRQDGEHLTTLDGEKRALTTDMTVISTPEQGAVALGRRHGRP